MVLDFDLSLALSLWDEDGDEDQAGEADGPVEPKQPLPREGLDHVDVRVGRHKRPQAREAAGQTGGHRPDVLGQDLHHRDPNHGPVA